jgi:hypothetical protein
LQPGTEDATIYFTGNVVSHGKNVGQDNPVLVKPEDLPGNATKLAMLKNRKRQLQAETKTLTSQNEINLLSQEIEREEMENEIMRKKITLLEQLKAQDSVEDSGEICRKQFEKMMKDRSLNRTDPTLGHKLHGIGNRGSGHNTSPTISTEHRSPGSPWNHFVQHDKGSIVKTQDKKSGSRNPKTPRQILEENTSSLKKESYKSTIKYTPSNNNKSTPNRISTTHKKGLDHSRTSPKQLLDESENYELQEIEAFDKRLGHHG